MTEQYFTPNGCIGRGSIEIPDFSSVEDYLAHLDYLGVQRSLVWHVAAGGLHPILGNRRLLDALDHPAARDRLFPAFVITPACFFETGTLDFLREQLASGRVRALRVTPEMSRYSLREIERLLGELASYAPVLFWNCGSSHQAEPMRDMEHLARTFPSCSFVMAQKMWPHFNAVLDVMWRCPNTYVDTSWLHMRDTIELLVDDFGPHRILFGLGSRAHYGAAIAALAHANLQEDAREQIAHGNLERLLKLDPYDGPEPAQPSLHEQKPHWRRFRAGLPVQGVEIVDAHGHTAPHTRGWIMRENRVLEGADALVARMDRLGVARLIVAPEAALFGESLEGNRDAEQLLAVRHAGRLSGYLVFNPLYAEEMVPAFDDFFSREFFVGFKLLPTYWKRPLNDAGYEPVWAYADRYRLPILMHTWGDHFCPPSMLQAIAPRFPGAVFVLGHSGGGTAGRLEAEALAGEHPNVFLEFCGSFTTPRPFEVSMGIVGDDRVLFGSDTGAHDQAWELGRYLSMPVPDAQLEAGLGVNMLRILAQRRGRRTP